MPKGEWELQEWLKSNAVTLVFSWIQCPGKRRAWLEGVDLVTGLIQQLNQTFSVLDAEMIQVIINTFFP